MPSIVLAFLALAVGYTGVFALGADRKDRPRVYIEASDSWEIESDPVFGTTDKKGRISIGGGSTHGGAKPRTAETIKRFAEQCKDVIVTMYKEKADFVVVLEHEGGKDLFNKDNKLAVFDRDGDLIASGSFSRPRKAVATACDAIVADSRRRSRDSDTD